MTRVWADDALLFVVATAIVLARALFVLLTE